MDTVLSYTDLRFMSSLSSKLKPFILTSSSTKVLSFFSTASVSHKTQPQTLTTPRLKKRINAVVSSTGVKSVDAAILKKNWLDSLSCTVPQGDFSDRGEDLNGISYSGSDWVIGVDPDLSGAIALLKTDESGLSAEVFDTPHLPVLVGKRVRKRLDTKSIVQLLRNINAPAGTTAYIEQNQPYPQDGKQGWWSGGFGYGLWIGILVASGFSVVPVPPLLWKNAYKLAGSSSTKDDSRRLASEFFPLLGSQLLRKKDHGRAEALLIAAYGKGLKKSSLSDEIVPTGLGSSGSPILTP